MIRGEAGLDLMAHGRLWIDTVTGRVLKTELQVQQPLIRAIVTTTFQFEERSGIAVPQEMREQYTFSNGNRVHGSRPTGASGASMSAPWRTSTRRFRPSSSHGRA